MIVTRCCTGSEARRSPDWGVLLVIGASFGIGKAIEQSGAAAYIANGMMSLGGFNERAALVTIYAIAMIFNAFITNNAAAVLVFPSRRHRGKARGKYHAVRGGTHVCRVQ